MATELARLGVRARAAVKSISTSSSAARDQALLAAADLLVAGSATLLRANRADLDRARANDLGAAALDRLTLDEGRIESMAAGLRGVATLADPVGEVVDGWVRPNGLRVQRVRVPLGVVGIIYVIDCLIPRAGRQLIELLLEHGTVPYVLDGDGNCHVYVDRSADLEMATDIVLNAKTQRPGVCNAAETLLVHRDVARRFLPAVARALDGVELRGDPEVCAILPGTTPATDDDFATEFLGPSLSVAVVDDIAAAIAHIDRYGSGHSEAIVTGDVGAADTFVREVDAAAVLVNASTRFVDGGELGLGAEVGISTQKLHARGPMGVRELTCTKWVVRGEGQVRQ